MKIFNTTFIPMRNKVLSICLLSGLVSLCGCSRGEDTVAYSPDHNVSVHFALSPEGAPLYQIIFDNDTILDPSPLGLILEKSSFEKGLSVLSVSHLERTENWKPVWGQYAEINSQCMEMSIDLINKNKEQMTLIFRVFDNGVGFRYRLPGASRSVICQELTGFNLHSDNKAYWNGVDWETDEHIYMESLVSEVNVARMDTSLTAGYAQHRPCATGFNTPLTMETPNGNFVSIHEAALWNYPAMSLCIDPGTTRLNVSLPGEENKKADVLLPFSTPWRVLMLGDKAGDLIESSLILNLNEPNKLTDLSYITPMKYLGIWWEMHLKISDWCLESGKHGANTANVKRYIDFAAEHGIKGVLVEGWNKGWEGWKNFRFSEPYPDFDMKEIANYAKMKNVLLIGHHETGSDVQNYITQLDSAFQYYKENGVHTVKTGYVGKIADHYHYDQFMVNHFNETVTKGAQYQIAVNIHEPVHPTGLCRTYPNLLSGEGMRGQEYNAWSEGNHINHNVTLPFTRNLAGPMDFTPGIFDLQFLNTINKRYKNLSPEQKEKYEWEFRVRSTLAHQLALYVVFYSPVQMVADLPENYVDQPAFQFIKDVPVDWADTKVLEAQIARHVLIARKDKISEEWYIGGIAGEKPYQGTFLLDFLQDGLEYEATIYADGKDASWDKNPTSVSITKQIVRLGDSLPVKMVPGGGIAVSVKPNVH